MRAKPFLFCCLFFLIVSLPAFAIETKLPLVSGVEWQPLSSQIKRILQALDYVGSPLPPEDVQALEKLYKVNGGSAADFG